MSRPTPISLGSFPTPLQRCPELGALLNISDLYVKRDDLTGYSWGGNKVRTIEFLLGDAIARDSDTIVVCGGPTSNFAALMASACAQSGIEIHQISYGDQPRTVPAALAAAIQARAILSYTGSSDRSSVDAPAAEICRLLQGKGRRPYLVPRGGATVVGAFGFARAAEELRRQLQQIGMDSVTVVLPVGSGGTIAGLIAGWTYDFSPVEDYPPFNVDLVGVCVSRPPSEIHPLVATMASECGVGAGRRQLKSGRCRWNLVDGRGEGFGISDRSDLEMIDHLTSRTRFLVDKTYNGKALLWLRQSSSRPSGSVVYWHTGGALAVADRLLRQGDAKN